MLDGRPIGWDELRPTLVELSGGEALAEFILDRGLEVRLQQRGMIISEDQIRVERGLFTTAVADDPNEAERLLQLVRRQRKLGELRFSGMLWRNAALRTLVQDQVEVPDALVRKAYNFQFGPRYHVRLILVEALAEASKLKRRVAEGESFIDLAVEHSIDRSRAQGGLLDPIRPSDTSYPQVLRKVLGRMSLGQVSDPILLDRGFAVVKLERLEQAKGTPFEAVEERLRREARLSVEQLHMERTAREIVQEMSGHLIVLDSGLSKSWRIRRAEMLGQVD